LKILQRFSIAGDGWVGHSDIQTTVNTYGHLEYQSKKKAAKIIEKSLPLK
jgi:integrase